MGYKSTGIVLAEKPSIGIEPTRLPDSSRFGNHGVYTDAPTDIQLPSGLWIRSFNGSSNLITVADHPSLQLTRTITILVWVKTDTSSDDGVLYKGGLGDDGDYTLRVLGAGTVRVGLNDGNRATSTGTVNDDAWHLIGFTYDMNAGGVDEIKIYIDGSADGVGDYSTVIQTSTDSLLIGRYFSNSFAFDGEEALLRIRNYALSAGQILKIFNAERHWFGV